MEEQKGTTGNTNTKICAFRQVTLQRCFFFFVEGNKFMSLPPAAALVQ